MSTTGEPLEVIDDPPEGAPVPELPAQPAVFAPDHAPEEIANRLRASSGIKATPEEMPAAKSGILNKARSVADRFTP